MKPALSDARLSARELVSDRVAVGRAEERLADVVARTRTGEFRRCVVLDQPAGKFLGVVRLAEAALLSHSGNRILADLMSGTPPVAVREDEPADGVALLFERHHLGEVLVVDANGGYRGLICAEEVFRWLNDENRRARDTLTALLAERDRLNEALERGVERRTAKLRAVVDEFRDASLAFSHDVGGPLRAIRGFADLLAEEQRGRLSPAGLEQVRRIRRAAERVEQMAAEILEKARRVVGTDAAGADTVELGEVLEDALQFHAALLDGRGALVTTRGDLPVVAGRYVPLLQVTTNLLVNAVKHVPAARRPEIEIWTEERGDRVLLHVKDNGRGVAPDERARIFEPFVRGAAADRPGLGLGLSITRHAVRALEAELTLETELGAGSVFTVSLRKAAGPAPSASERS